MKSQAFLLLTVLFVFSCNSEKKNDEFLLTLLPPSVTNIKFENRLTETDESNIIEYLYFNNGAGVAAGDINNDGLADLYFTSNQNPNKLYLNRGNMLFEDITDKAGVAGAGNWKTGVTMADVNGDGLLDIYVCQVGNYKSYHGKNQLFINQGNLTFRDEASEYGLDFSGFSTQAAFFDYDKDGDLDMYLLNHSVHTSRSYGDVTLRYDFDPLAGDRLFRHDVKNDHHVFSDVTGEAGIFSSQIGYGLGVNICDINSDGLPDIYVSNDFHENDYLYINNGNGTFSEKLTSLIAHTSRSSMGNDVADFNNDALPDIVVLDMLPDNEKIRRMSAGEDDYELFELKLKFGYNYQFVRNVLQLNLGGGMFSEIGLLAGIYSTDWSWSPLFCDIDNDGWKDLFITNGIYRRANDLDYIKFLTGGNRFFPEKDNSKVSDRELYEKMPLYPNINYLFRNNRDLTFKNMTANWGFKLKSYSNGSTYADLDNDGDLDLVVNNINNPAYIYRNNSEKNPDNHFLSVVMKGMGLNTRGIGARITLYSNGTEQMADQFPTRGFMSATSDVLHFGLGTSQKVDSLVVRWPDLSEERLKVISANQTIILDNKNASRNSIKIQQNNSNPRLFAKVNIPGLDYQHIEDPYVDFKREHLIPHSLTSEGPAITTGDVNGDSMEDIFIGSAKGQASALYLQQVKVNFTAAKQPPFEKVNTADDVDAVFFDADNDGDLDLYIVRGGNELQPGNPGLSDILYINDGKGRFADSEKGALPVMSHNGSCVRPCDFDKDGDLDLFIGSRSVPGAYGLSPDQYLLQNDGHGRFTDVTSSRSNGLRNVGMVTDACWLDFDGDGDQDLAVTGEWMRVSVFRNDNGYFKEVSSEAGLSATTGWWNCIRAFDIDQDGDMDLIAGNLGLNSILKASVTEPVRLYLNDFDNNGTADPIICTYQNRISYPVASLDEMAKQITGLSGKYPSYSEFAAKTIYDIFGKRMIDQSVIKEATLFESSLFINNGRGNFERVILPVEAQFSPLKDIVVGDFNGDGKNDLIIAGNDFQVLPSIGRYDASFGWFLEGNTAGGLSAKMPVSSGLRIDGDARHLRVIKISNKKYLLSAVNNGSLQVFEINGRN